MFTEVLMTTAQKQQARQREELIGQWCRTFRKVCAESNLHWGVTVADKDTHPRLDI